MPPVILVVDDHGETRTFIARSLHLRGYEVVAVGDGQAALTAAAAQFRDLLIADVLLPDMHGLTVIATLRRHDPRLRVTPSARYPMCSSSRG